MVCGSSVRAPLTRSAKTSRISSLFGGTGMRSRTRSCGVLCTTSPIYGTICGSNMSIVSSTVLLDMEDGRVTICFSVGLGFLPFRAIPHALLWHVRHSFPAPLRRPAASPRPPAAPRSSLAVLSHGTVLRRCSCALNPMFTRYASLLSSVCTCPSTAVASCVA